jgi:hypothetical protein
MREGCEEENDCRVNEDKRSKIVLEGALDGITINEFVSFLTLVDLDKYKIRVSDETIEALIQKAIERKQLKEDEKRPGFLTGKTTSGEELIHCFNDICYEDIGLRVYEKLVKGIQINKKSMKLDVDALSKSKNNVLEEALKAEDRSELGRCI